MIHMGQGISALFIYNCNIRLFPKLGNRKLQEVMERDKRMDDFITVTELATFFRVCPKTIYRRLWARAIPAYMVGRTWRIAKKDIIWFRQ